MTNSNKPKSYNQLKKNQLKKIKNLKNAIGNQSQVNKIATERQRKVLVGYEKLNYSHWYQNALHVYEKLKEKKDLINKLVKTETEYLKNKRKNPNLNLKYTNEDINRTVKISQQLNWNNASIPTLLKKIKNATGNKLYNAKKIYQYKDPKTTIMKELRNFNNRKRIAGAKRK